MSPARVLHPLGRSWFPALLLMTLLWGFSFFFIAIALRSFAPSQVAFGRIVIGAVLLLAILAVRRIRPQLSRRQWLDIVVVGITLCAAPFLLNSTAQTYVTSVLAGLLNATMPLFTAIFVAILIPRERSDLRGMLGLLVGFLGIAVLLGVWQVGSASALGAGLILGATACYGFGTTFTRLRLSNTGLPPLVLPALQLASAAVVLVPFVAVAPPPTSLTWGPALALLGLGLGCTGLAYVLFWRVIAIAGATVAASSTYLIPLVSTTLGVLALHERLDWYEPVGGVIVLLGVALTQHAACEARTSRPPSTSSARSPAGASRGREPRPAVSGA